MVSCQTWDLRKRCGTSALLGVATNHGFMMVIDVGKVVMLKCWQKMRVSWWRIDDGFMIRSCLKYLEISWNGGWIIKGYHRNSAHHREEPIAGASLGAPGRSNWLVLYSWWWLASSATCAPQHLSYYRTPRSVPPRASGCVLWGWQVGSWWVELFTMSLVVMWVCPKWCTLKTGGFPIDS